MIEFRNRNGLEETTIFENFNRMERRKSLSLSLSPVFLINENYFIIACTEPKNRDPRVSKRGHEAKKTHLSSVYNFFPLPLSFFVWGYARFECTRQQLATWLTIPKDATFGEKLWGKQIVCVGTRSGCRSGQINFIKKCN